MCNLLITQIYCNDEGGETFADDQYTVDVMSMLGGRIYPHPHPAPAPAPTSAGPEGSPDDPQMPSFLGVPKTQR